MLKDEYIRWATVSDVLDGDTIIASIDLGFSVAVKIELRLLDVFAFETKGSEKELGVKDKLALLELAPINSKILIQTLKTKSGKDKKSFTRYISKVWLPDGQLLNEILVSRPQGGIGVK